MAKSPRRRSKSTAPKSNKKAKKKTKRGNKGPSQKKQNGNHSAPNQAVRKKFAGRGRPRREENEPRKEAGVPPEKLQPAQEKTDSSLKAWLEESRAIREKGAPINPPMDPWQAEALEALKNGENVIVDAPTTAGKTRVVEEFFKLYIDEAGFRAAYTAPVKSLSNDKLREFSEMFGRENVGIATGDVKENLDAPIVVATLESYRNSLLGVEPDLGRKLVIFDEYHFMQDSGRGSAWEEAIILSPPSCQLLLLSASVDNAETFASWIESLTHRTCRLVRTLTRPVPLESLVYYGESWVLGSEVEKIHPKTKARPARFPLEHDEVARRASSLPELNLTPCIVYAGQRLACENLARELCRNLAPLPKEDSKTIAEILETECEVENVTQYMKSNLRKMLIMYGVGYHHSGIAPAGRRAVEILVKKGRLRFCTATMGLSIGINFSVRSTLIADYRRPGENGFTQYGASEVLQMLGRAGRRGSDAVGFSLWPSTDSYYKFGKTSRETCLSRLKNDPTTFLGLIGRGFNLREVEKFYEKSFLRFTNKKADFRLLRAGPLRKRLKVDELPCESPAAEITAYYDEERAQCHKCPLMDRCHDIAENMGSHSSSNFHLHLHLHRLGCLTEYEKLSEVGSAARFFPQGGGLLFSSLLITGEISQDNLLAAVELMACLSMARFKEPGTSAKYRFPFDERQLEKDLEDYYPEELFPELYDPPNNRRPFAVIREFNPAAGYAVKEWVKGMSWPELRAKVCHEKFAEGDLAGLMYRTATYLQSLSQAHLPEISRSAKDLRTVILREPLTPAVKTSTDLDEEPTDQLQDEETSEEQT